MNCADDSTWATPKSLCTRLLMTTVKKDVFAVETVFEHSSLPLYRSSQTFQSVSLSGSRVLEIDGNKLTKTQCWTNILIVNKMIFAPYAILFQEQVKSQ